MEGVFEVTTAGQGDPARGHISTYLRVAVGGGLALFGRAGGPWGQGLKSLNLGHFQGPEHVKHEGFGPPGP